MNLMFWPGQKFFLNESNSFSGNYSSGALRRHFETKKGNRIKVEIIEGNFEVIFKK